MANRGPIPEQELKAKYIRIVDELHPPKWLSSRAKRKYKEYGEMLRDSGLLTTSDIAAWGMLWQSWDLALTAAESIKKDGPTVKDERGFIRKHPGFQIWRDNIATFNKLANDFALTPASRARLNIQPGRRSKGENDFFEALLDDPND